MVTFSKVATDASLEELLHALCNSYELLDATMLRRTEKKHLNAFDKQTRFSLDAKLKVQTKADKVSVLLQTHLGGLKCNEFGLNNDIRNLTRATQRITRALVEYCQLRELGDAHASAVVLQKCLRRRMWESATLRHVQQLPSIGEAMGAALAAAGIDTIGAVRVRVCARV